MLLRWLLIDHLVTLILDTHLSPFHNTYSLLALIVLIDLSVITGKKSLRRIPAVTN